MSRMKLETNSNIAICKITRHHFKTEHLCKIQRIVAAIKLNNKELVEG